MIRTDQLIEFAILHMKTCGQEALAVEIEGTSIIQRCQCGAELALSLSFDEVEALRDQTLSDARFGEALRRASRRVVQ